MALAYPEQGGWGVVARPIDGEARESLYIAPLSSFYSSIPLKEGWVLAQWAASLCRVSFEPSVDLRATPSADYRVGSGGVPSSGTHYLLCLPVGNSPISTQPPIMVSVVHKPPPQYLSRRTPTRGKTTSVKFLSRRFLYMYV